jgi:hypothetical protein
MALDGFNQSYSMAFNMASTWTEPQKKNSLFHPWPVAGRQA